MVSVIIRNRNEKDYIGFAIQSVIDYIDNPEIIVIDNNSTDDSLKVVSLFDKYNIKVFSIDSYTPGKALNLGVSKCSFETVLILSAHSQITKFNFNLVQDYLTNNVAVFGNQTPIYRGKKISKRYIWSHFQDKKVINMYSEIEKRPFLHNAFCLYKREHLLKFPFDEKLSGKEDRYWAIDMNKQHYDYLYTPELEVNHFFTTNGATWHGLG